MKAHQLSVTGRGDVCARSCSCVTGQQQDVDPEMAFELELAEALAEHGIEVGGTK
jgi:hypothetical protein